MRHPAQMDPAEPLSTSNKAGSITGLVCIFIYNTIHMYSGITSGRVLDGELLYTKILEVNLLMQNVPLIGEKSL